MSTPPAGWRPESGSTSGEPTSGPGGTSGGQTPDPAGTSGPSEPFEPNHPVYWEQTAYQGPWDRPAYPFYPVRPTHPGYTAQPTQHVEPGGPERPVHIPPAYVDLLTPEDVVGWFERVAWAIRRSYPRLLAIATVPTAVMVAIVLAVATTMPNAAEMAEHLRADPTLIRDAYPALTAMLGDFLPLVAVFSLLFLIATVYAQAASFFVVVVEAKGQPTTVNEAMRFARGPLMRLTGWSLLAGALIIAGYALLIVPGIYLQVALPTLLPGVVIVERGGLGRCLRLIRGRFWVTACRLAVAMAVVLVYSVAVGLIAGLAMSASPVLSSLIQVVAVLPTVLFFNAVYVITYAELRHRENPSVTTGTLARELIQA